MSFGIGQSSSSLGVNGYDHHEAQQYELTEYGLLSKPPQYGDKYPDGSSIDWLHEEAVERERSYALQSEVGIRGALLPALDSVRMWIVVIATGVAIGLVGAWLDLLVKWLGDIREGWCEHGFFHNSVSCCAGLATTVGERCEFWMRWGDPSIQSMLGRSLLQAFIYVALAVIFGGSSALLVTRYAPYAFHTGIPEIKAILSGYVFDAFLTPRTLLIKALGLALSVASGLSLGKEGPLVHVSCCLASLFSRMFTQFRRNEASKRRLLAAAAAAGVSVAFGSPLGGVLFGLEELDTFANETDVMWKGFVASAVAAVALQWVNPFGTAKLVLFQVTAFSDQWRGFELIPWIGLGIIGGVLGSYLIRLNVEIAIYRRQSVVGDWPVLEVVGASAITATLSYLVVFARVPTSELVANLFQDCDPKKPDYHGLCNPSAMKENIFLLILTAFIKIPLTAWTFGMSVPAGMFLPTIGIGACLGRAVGLITQSLYRAYPKAWIFYSCPPDPSIRCISPGFYAVIGAAGMLGGVTRMTISLVVILFELTGALSHVLPIMVCVMTSKWVGDALGKDGIYSVWIAMKRYPWLPPVDYRDNGETGAHLMTPVHRLILIREGQTTVKELTKMLDEHNSFHGFPVIDSHQEFIGYATRDSLLRAIDGTRFSDDYENVHGKKCTFSKNFMRVPARERVDMSSALEQTLIQLRKEVPQELVVTMFQKLNTRQIFFTNAGKLTGMVTKRDVVTLLTSHFPHAGTLAKPLPHHT
ncbi:Cl-channel protein [Coprinopsis marcescibilis]|uniref:Chloride channel protein n=1 Tax=Coprinopsis marcescibilis TaxID=230819 RepID=A0A5C3L233_COPMA|nr:Cl-channel protein [Coprinopsis marcescibilis]